MNLNIYPVRMNNSYMNVRKESEPQKPIENAPAFQGNIRKPLLALVAGTLIGAGAVSCTNNNKAQQDTFLSEHDGGEEKSDKLGRLKEAADGTEYFYKGDSEEAYKTVETKDGCQHVTIYGEGGALANTDNILEEYFIAKDGTKTDASVLNEIKW